MSKNKGYDNPGHNKAHGRRDGESPKKDAPQRERNIGHKSGEEHSRINKGGDKTYSKK